MSEKEPDKVGRQHPEITGRIMYEQTTKRRYAHASLSGTIRDPSARR